MEKAVKIIADINGWFLQLEGFGIENQGDLEDPKNFHAVSMLLFSIINGAITLGEEIVAVKSLGFPASYREVFEILNKNGIISRELTTDMSRLVSYRNMFAHEYNDFAVPDVWDALQRIRSAKVFVGEAKKVLR